MKRQIIILFFYLSGIINLLQAQQQNKVEVSIVVPVPPDTVIINKPGTIVPLASQQQSNLEVPPVVPPSPDAAALGKYGNTPVGLNTGIPDINIPLYTIKTRKLEVPISVSFHAGGFKVSEFATWIGLGWSLNAGGVISRSVVGYPDESGQSVGFLSRFDIQNASQLTTSDYTYMSFIANNIEDGESDYYFYNFNRHSGKFVYYQNNSTQPLLIPKEPIKVERVSDRYEITDEMGVKYKFTMPESLNFTGPTGVQFSFISSYYLSEIISADGIDHIYFTYETEAAYAENNFEFTETVGQQCLDEPHQVIDNYRSSNYVNIYRAITPVRLKEINFANGKVEFIKDDTRNDAPKTRLNLMKIYEKNSDGTFSILKSFSFGEGYFDSPGGTGTERYRLKLTGITEMDSQGTSIKNHSFYYNEAEMLPPRNSLAQDWWGFYNGQTTNISLISTDTVLVGSVYYQIGSANRQPVAAKMQACILKKIVYPTGGFTEFDFEPNYYGSTSNIMAGGLRMKEIRDYEATGKTPVKKIYVYGTNQTGRGTLLIPEEGYSNSKQEIKFEKWYPSGSFCVPDCEGFRMIITGRPAYELSTLNGAPVVYPEVRVYEENNSSAPNGFQLSQFSVYEDQFFGVDRAYNNGRYQSNESWKGGDETYKGSYIGTSGNKSEEIVDTYSFLSLLNATGTKIGWKITREGCPMPAENINDFYFFDYPIYSGIKKLTSNSTKQYSLTDPVNYFEAKTTFDYSFLGNQHQQLTKKSIINSTGDTSKTKYWYPADYGSAISGVLLTKNIIAVPIKEENYRNTKITTGKVIQYNDYGNPKEIDIFETDQPQPSPIHNPNQLVPTGYVKRAEMFYDANQNLLTMQKTDNMKTSYLWGYYKTFPVAKIENASYQQVQTAMGGSIPDLGGGGLTTSQINSLRNGLPNALISTFTYKPLIGLTTQTDQNSITTYFEYDYFGRLKWIKDNDGRILKTYEYHYK
jgi:YD repeat-containing protein